MNEILLLAFAGVLVGSLVSLSVDILATGYLRRARQERWSNVLQCIIEEIVLFIR